VETAEPFFVASDDEWADVSPTLLHSVTNNTHICTSKENSVMNDWQISFGRSTITKMLDREAAVLCLQLDDDEILT
jgi:hypothetical protein